MEDANERYRRPVSLNVKSSDNADEIIIYGIRYSGALFRGLGFSIREDETFQIIKRADGVVTVQVTRNDEPDQASGD